LSTLSRREQLYASGIYYLEKRTDGMIDNTVLGAIIGAIGAGALDGTKDVAKKALSDGYDKLKTSLISRFGGNNSLANAITQVEAKPSSAGRLKVLEEELTESGAASDLELSIYASELGEIIKNLQGTTGSQVAHGTGIAQADRSSTASVTMTRNDK
jgi:hypothetical protein